MSNQLYGYLFQTFYHPYVNALVRQLNSSGVDGLLQRELQLYPQDFQPNPPSEPTPDQFDFDKTYNPNEDIVAKPYPSEDIDFEPGSSYSQYNWEIFFHVPLLIADRLSKNQRFEEAQRWFHYIFNPTDSSKEPAPDRYWQTKKFFRTSAEEYKEQRIEHILYLLAKGGDPEAELTPDEQEELKKLEGQVLKWRKNPFKPHMIARLRTTAYQKSVVMKYLDNLIAWGDQLFRRDTIETINEATQLYVLAAEILGRRPQDVPPRATPRVQTYNSLEPTLGKFSDSLVAIEEFIPPSALGDAFVNVDEDPPIAMPYFCVPPNDKLLGYWDIVADRLFKIRHCMNIEGVERQLPLFEPPIDPGLLVKAAAAGLDLGTVLNDVSASLPHYRFNILAQKAAELCAEVKALGGALLSALEKQDAEELALLRAGHESALLKLVEQVKQRQLDEATQNLKALRKSRNIAEVKYVHYLKLLGVKSPKLPSEGEQVPEQPASENAAMVDEDGVKMTGHEKEESVSTGEAQDKQSQGAEREFTASIYHAFPNINVAPFGCGTTLGGSNLGNVASALASEKRLNSLTASFGAARAGNLGRYLLRAHDWTLQSNVTGAEIGQIDQQIVAAQIRETLAANELENHKEQIKNAEAIEATMRDKYTNQELYGWMIGQVSGVYFQAYQLAYDVAKRAERTYRFELGLKDSNFIQFGYWDSLHRGLLAGEKLYQDLKRMEAAYLDQNRREYEITKHVSLVQLDPLALIAQTER